MQRVAARPACQRCARLLLPGLSPLFILHRPTPHCRTPPPCLIAEQYLAKPGARPYCSAQPQRVSMPPFAEWAPAGLLEKHAPKLPEAFWKKYGLSGNSKACGVVGRPNEPVKMGDW